MKIIQGDCNEYLPKIPTGSIHCIITDPPFGINFNDGDMANKREIFNFAGEKKKKKTLKEHARPIANDSAEDADKLLKKVLPELNRVLVKGGVLCVCTTGGGGSGGRIAYAKWSIWIDKMFDFKQLVVWDKGKMGMGWHFRRSYETVIVASKKGKPCKWYDKSGRIENIIRPNSNGIKKILPRLEDHPCAKPPQLAQFFLRLFTQEENTVLDPFCGAGWVGEACKRMGRDFIGIEIDPHWAEVSRNRILYLTPTNKTHDKKGLFY
jgi:site-specific DNA-methyltransferase (adenine-specific)